MTPTIGLFKRAEFERSKAGGLWIPEEEPAAPARTYGPLEIQDARQREQVAAALRELYDAAKLKQWSQIKTPENAGYEVHRAAWELMARLMLGDDMPSMEQWT